MVTRILLAALMAATLSLTACGGVDDGILDVAIMDSEENLFSTGNRLSNGGQHIRAAVRSGLVAMDQRGEVVPALADRWNVTDSGSIFVFRLREGTWPDGRELTAESVRQALNLAKRDLRGTSLGIDLAPIDEVRAMVGRVVEIRLASPVPDLLFLLAQPEMGLDNGEGETGAMELARGEVDALLSLKPPLQRGLPEIDDWRDFTRDIRLHALDPASAIARFDEGEVDVVLGGRLASLPLADTGPLTRGTVRVDPAIGLFGLQVRRARGLLATADTREAIAMTIDRSALAAVFNIGGWLPTTRLVAPNLASDPGYIGERWVDLALEERRSIAASRISAWQSGNASQNASENPGEALTLTIAISRDAGHVLLFDELSAQLATIGIALVRSEDNASADLLLVDRAARYASPRWFLNQFNCLLGRGLCSEQADILAGRALDELDSIARARLLAEAEVALTAANVYIPFGSPLRWSLVRGDVVGFSGNRWGFHPLSDMAVIPR